MKATKQLIRWLAVTNRDFHTCGPECNDGTCKVLAQERFVERRTMDELDKGDTIMPDELDSTLDIAFVDAVQEAVRTFQRSGACQSFRSTSFVTGELEGEFTFRDPKGRWWQFKAEMYPAEE